MILQKNFHSIVTSLALGLGSSYELDDFSDSSDQTFDLACNAKLSFQNRFIKFDHSKYDRTVSSYLAPVVCFDWFKLVYWKFGQSKMQCTLETSQDYFAGKN